MEDKLAVARRWVELYNERSDVAEFVSLLDPEVELQTPGGPRLHGHDQARLPATAIRALRHSATRAADRCWQAIAEARVSASIPFRA